MKAAKMKPTVHIVEDDEANRNSLRDVLEIYGFPVAVFASGEEFFARMPSDPESCVIIDFNLPGANGLEVLRRLRTDRGAIPAVVVSGRATSDMRAQAARLGASFFEKPIDIDQLVTMIEPAAH